MAYATVGDLEARWRKLSESERTRAGTLLDDAAAILDAELARCGADPADLEAALRYVSCQMVRRTMAAGGAGPMGAGAPGDVSQWSRTSGPFSESFSFANPSGDMYLTSADRRLLGVQLRRGRATQIGPC